MKDSGPGGSWHYLNFISSEVPSCMHFGFDSVISKYLNFDTFSDNALTDL
jgi:hypothetical protein